VRGQQTISLVIDYESQAARMLLAIASRRDGIDTGRCGLAFEDLGVATRLHQCLHKILVSHQPNDLQFAALVVLFEMEPKPIPMAALAEHTAVSLPAATDALDKLEALRVASRTPDSVTSVSRTYFLAA
jgi:hypothetical protein